jgi:hypothetical protein
MNVFLLTYRNKVNQTICNYANRGVKFKAKSLKNC